MQIFWEGDMNAKFYSLAIINTFFVLLVSVSNIAYALSVEEAYQAIPHKQTTFNAKESTLDEKEALLLGRVFALTDMAIVKKVEALQWLTSNGSLGTDPKLAGDAYSALISQLKKTEVQPKLAPIVKGIISALEAQRSYLIKASKTDNKEFVIDATDPLVRSTHTNLIQAFDMLKKLYPKENPHNSQAYFDHLCALDFI